MFGRQVVRKPLEEVCGKVEIGSIRQNELELIVFGEPIEVLSVEPVAFSAGRAFDVDDAHTAWIDDIDVHASVRFQQHGVPVIEKPPDQFRRFRLKQGLSSRDFHPTTSEASNSLEDLPDFKSFFDNGCIARIAIRARKVASGKADKDAGKPGIGGFALNAEKDFVYIDGHDPLS